MQGVHPGTLGLVARALPVRGHLLHRRAHKKNLLCRGRVQVGRKGFGAIQIRLLPAKVQGPYLRTPKPGFAVASAKLASWFAAVAACHRAMQGIAGCSAARVKIGTMVTKP